MDQNSTYPLNKIQVLMGMQCMKMLYLHIHRTELARISPNADKLESAESSYRMHDEVKMLFPDGIEIKAENILESIAETQKILNSNEEVTLFGASFSNEIVQLYADVFIKNRSGYQFLDVKDIQFVENPQIIDCAIQAWVIEEAGYPLNEINIVHPNVNYAFSSKGDELIECFDYVDVTDLAKKDYSNIQENVSLLQDMLEGQEPIAQTGPQCDGLFQCEFFNYCEEG
jgi:hypothetical protein